MHVSRSIVAKVLILAIFFAGPVAYGQGEVIDRIGNLIDSISRSLKSIGEKSTDYIAPGVDSLGQVVFDTSGLATTSQPRDKNVPASPTVDLSVENEFGEIYIDTWENPVVAVHADVYVGAENADLARKVADQIKINIDAPQEDHVSIQTEYPDTRDYNVVTEVNYRITIPKGAHVRCANTFGDTVVHNVNGPVQIDARYGGVNLMDLGGSVSVRGRGEYPLFASGLKSGGQFELVWMKAEFRNISGPLTVSNYMGSVDASDMSQANPVEIRSRNGPLHYNVDEGSKPDLTATVLFGKMHSDVPLDQQFRRNVVDARWSNVESKQHVELFASFADLYVHQHSSTAAKPAPQADGTESVKGEVARVVPIADGAELSIDATVGNIVIEGTDDDKVSVKGEQLVRVASSSQAMAALEALAVNVDQKPAGLDVKTQVLEDMADLGCSYYRIDLKIKCPRNTKLKIHAASGRTSVTDIGGAVNIEQEQGTVSVERAESTLNLRNLKGDVSALDCAGPVVITAQSGEVMTRTIRGKQTVICTDGKTVVDAPNGEVTVRNNGGDIRIIALDGIRGNYDVWVNEGNISIVRPEWADAEFIVSIEHGHLDSVVPLVGELSRDRLDVRGRLNKGTNKVTLTALNGDVVID